MQGLRYSQLKLGKTYSFTYYGGYDDTSGPAGPPETRIGVLTGRTKVDLSQDNKRYGIDFVYDDVFLWTCNFYIPDVTDRASERHFDASRFSTLMVIRHVLEY